MERKDKLSGFARSLLWEAGRDNHVTPIFINSLVGKKWVRAGKFGFGTWADRKDFTRFCDALTELQKNLLIKKHPGGYILTGSGNQLYDSLDFYPDGDKGHVELYQDDNHEWYWRHTKLHFVVQISEEGFSDREQCLSDARLKGLIKKDEDSPVPA